MVSSTKTANSQHKVFILRSLDLEWWHPIGCASGWYLSNQRIATTVKMKLLQSALSHSLRLRCENWYYLKQTLQTLLMPESWGAYMPTENLDLWLPCGTTATWWHPYTLASPILFPCDSFKITLAILKRSRQYLVIARVEWNAK